MADTVKYIFAESESIGDIHIYPVQMKHYDEFMETAGALNLHYGYYNVEEWENAYGINKLLDIILFSHKLNDQLNDIVDVFEKIFTFACRQDVKYDVGVNAFFINNDDNLFINSENYDEVRNVIMKQNLIFEPKVYKHESTQRLAEKILKAKAKNSLKYSIEDMVTTLVIGSSMTFSELRDCSIYQIKALFQRLLQYENYKTIMLFKTVDSSGKLNADHFAEEINMFVDPYKDLFKDKSQFNSLKSVGLSLDE